MTMNSGRALPLSNFAESYEHLLRAVSGAKYPEKQAVPPVKLSVFSCHVGAKYDGGLMVVGRALNGGGYELPNNYEEEHATIAERLIRPTSACPMQWIVNQWGKKNGGQYDPKRSAFWRVIKSISRELRVIPEQSFDSDWSSHLVWSNLYKVAPIPEKKDPTGEERKRWAKGNPSAKLIRVQQKACAQILASEIRQHRPSYILFLTGYSWIAPFLGHWGVAFSRESAWPQAWAGNLSEARAAVLDHPQGKPEDEYVKLAVRLLSAPGRCP